MRSDLRSHAVDRIHLRSVTYIAAGRGRLKRSPHYALPLNAEPLTSHEDDSQLSAGYPSVEPARVDFTSLRGVHFPSRGHCHITTRARKERCVLATCYGYLFGITLLLLFLGVASVRGDPSLDF